MSEITQQTDTENERIELKKHQTAKIAGHDGCILSVSIDRTGFRLICIDHEMIIASIDNYSFKQPKYMIDRDEDDEEIVFQYKFKKTGTLNQTVKRGYLVKW